MGFSASTLRRIALVVLLAVLGVRLADAHVHVCFDGLEPPVSVHSLDGSVHNDAHHHQAEHHQDQDVKPFDAALLKVSADADAAPLVAASWFALLLPTQVGQRPESIAAPVLRPPSQLKPPLRGPPL